MSMKAALVCRQLKHYVNLKKRYPVCRSQVLFISTVVLPHSTVCCVRGFSLFL